MLGLADLARSGLTEADAEALGIEFLPPAETARRLPGHCQAALTLPYFEPSGKRRRDLFRARLLEAPPAKAFGARAVEWIRYAQPAGTPPAVYLAPGVPWAGIFADREQPLWLTEGEKKAACACKAGLRCLGLGGVWSFGSKAAATELLPELEQVTWDRRPVYICFDSDVMVKPEVAKAIARLTDILVRRGALVSCVYLPELVPGQKCGLDDFLVARGRKGLDALLDKGDLVEGDLAVALWRMSERFAVLEHPASIYDEAATDHHGRPQPKPMSASAFTNVVAAAVRATKLVNDRMQVVSVAEAWLQWPCRRAFEALTYAPGQPKVLPHRRLNSWISLSVEPKKGDVGPWVRLLDHLFTGAEPEARRWFERWCGYPLYKLGTKLLTAVGIWSARQGQGKTLVGETLGRIYGANFISIPQLALESDFTSWALGRQFVLVDDISSHDTRQRADLLKKLITQRDFNVNLKHVPQFTMPDYLNYYFTSNHGDAFYLDEHDRRLFIHEVSVGKLPAKFYDDYYAWMDGDGPAALLHYLQRELDYGDFSPTQPPPLTGAKKEMIEGVRSELDAWLVGLEGLDLAGRELWTAGELCEKFNSAAVGRRVAPNAFGRRLRRFYPCVGLVEEGEGRRNRYHAVKNAEKWLKATGKEKTTHVRTTRRF
jgi:hypothetical protein